MDLKPDYKEEYAGTIRAFITDSIKEAGADGVVVGLSGGLDSAVTLKLCAEALGAEKVLALLMPDKDSNPRDAKDSAEFAEGLGVEYEVIDITKSLDAFSDVLKWEIHKVVLGNVKARCRMIILYSHANSLNRLVAGTGNKSELLVGYFTKYGDGGVDFLPLGDLYKTQVYELARAIGVPEKILQKVPSAGLWKGQTDEGELKMSYGELDQILHGFELELSPDEIASRTKLPIEEVERIGELVRKNAHKREPPYVPG